MTKCINCKKNISDEELDEKGYKCEDCDVYLCNDCSFNVLYKFFADYSYGDFCIKCHNNS